MYEVLFAYKISYLMPVGIWTDKVIMVRGGDRK